MQLAHVPADNLSQVKKKVSAREFSPALARRGAAAPLARYGRAVRCGAGTARAAHALDREAHTQSPPAPCRRVEQGVAADVLVAPGAGEGAGTGWAVEEEARRVSAGH